MAGVLDQVRAGNLEAVRAASRSLDQSDRRPLAPSALSLLRKIRQAYIGQVLKRPWPYGDDKESVLTSARVLVLATISPGDLRKLGFWGVPPDDLAFEVLSQRRDAAAALVDAIANQRPTRWNSRFALIRRVVRAGVIDRPSNPGYILAMINGLETRDLTVYKALKADPALLEHEVWRLFEVEGAGDTSLAAHDKYSPEQRNWAWALTRLSAEGQLPKRRLLDASLAALRRDFAPFRAGWFSRFHEALNPTPEERHEREAEYVGLLTSPVPATVSFAVQALRAGGSISDGAAERLSPALQSRAVSTVRAAIGLLPKSEVGAVVAANALPQATRDGQRALLAFISGLGRPDPRVADLVSAAMPALAPSLRNEARKLSGVRTTAEPDQPRSTRFQTIPEPPGNTDLAQPVQSVPELVELLARLLEGIESVHDLERAIDGVSRLCDRGVDTLRELAPVHRRAQKVITDTGGRPFSGTSPRADVAGLVVAWSTGEAPPVPPLRESRLGFIPVKGQRPRRSVLGFLSYRVLEVAARAAHGRAEPILSFPTNLGGAIDPETLALRRDDLRRRGIKPGDADAIQAALRVGEVTPPEGIRLSFGSEATSHTYQGKTYKHVRFHLDVQPTPDEKPALQDVASLFVAAILADGFRRAEADYCGIGSESPAGLAEAVRWVASVWPDNREFFYAKGAVELGQNIDWWEARWHARYFLEPLLIPTEPIGDMGRLLLALGLAAKEPGERSMAKDVFIAGVGQGRLKAEDLGAILATLYNQGVVKGSRLAAALFDVDRVSDRHGQAVAVTVEHMLAGLYGPPPADLHAVLNGFRDLLASLGTIVHLPAARAYLSGIEGTGKAAAAAKALLADS